MEKDNNIKIENLKLEIAQLEKMLEEKTGNLKYIKKLLKEAYKNLKEECKRNEHNFTDWEPTQYSNPEFDVINYNVYGKQSFPIYTRICKDCGYMQIKFLKPKEYKKTNKNK